MNKLLAALIAAAFATTGAFAADAKKEEAKPAAAAASGAKKEMKKDDKKAAAPAASRRQEVIPGSVRQGQRMPRPSKPGSGRVSSFREPSRRVAPRQLTHQAQKRAHRPCPSAHAAAPASTAPAARTAHAERVAEGACPRSRHHSAGPAIRPTPEAVAKAVITAPHPMARSQMMREKRSRTWSAAGACRTPSPPPRTKYQPSAVTWTDLGASQFHQPGILHRLQVAPARGEVARACVDQVRQFDRFELHAAPGT
jgi:hypothetical protein